MFFSLAEKLSRDPLFEQVYYATPWANGFPTVGDNVVGDGYDNIERATDFFRTLHKLPKDRLVICFPDTQDSGLQLHLDSLGYRVWGSREGDRLELDRVFLKEMEKKLGLPVPEYHVVKGVTALRDHLKDKKSKWIKISTYRGTAESWKHINSEMSEPFLDYLAFKLSGVKEHVKFLVESEIDTDLELGSDQWVIDGQFPKRVCHGIETKDRGALTSVVDYADLPEELREVQEAFVPFFKENQYRNFFSTEIRLKDDKAYFTDATCRQASPCGENVLELIENIGEIIWHGSDGEMVQPEFVAEFAAQAIISHKRDDDHWRPIQVPEKVRQFVKLYKPVFNGDCDYIVPASPHFSEIGSVIGIGDTIEDALNHLKKNIKLLGDNPIEVSVDALYDALKEAHSAEKKGVPFTDGKIPKPEIALSS